MVTVLNIRCITFKAIGYIILTYVRKVNCNQK
jgi:hypothetical protein